MLSWRKTRDFRKFTRANIPANPNISTRLIQETIKENLQANQQSSIRINIDPPLPTKMEVRPQMRLDHLNEFVHANLNKYTSGFSEVSRGRSLNREGSGKSYKIFDNIEPKHPQFSASKTFKVAQFVLPTESQSEEDSMTNYKLVKSSKNL